MKKLMIAAAIVCAAALSQAATAKWVAQNIYVPGASPDTKAAGYGVYFINSADYALASAASDLSNGDLSKIVAAATDGAYKTTSSGAATIQGWGNFGNGESITGYLLIVNAAEAGDADLAYLSKEYTASTGGEGAQASFTFGKFDGTGSYGLDTRSAGNWYAIPEPTSGLLLLLGVAGLALKRRRA